MHKFPHELKWAKVHYKYIPFYKGLIDYFLSCADMSFRCIIVDKTKVKLEEFHDNDEELAFFKFYYLLLGCTNNIVYRFLMLRILITSYTNEGYFLYKRNGASIRSLIEKGKDLMILLSCLITSFLLWVNIVAITYWPSSFLLMKYGKPLISILPLESTFLT